MCECLSLRNLFGLCWVSCIRLSVFASESDSDFVFVFEKTSFVFCMSGDHWWVWCPLVCITAPQGAVVRTCITAISGQLYFHKHKQLPHLGSFFISSSMYRIAMFQSMFEILLMLHQLFEMHFRRGAKRNHHGAVNFLPFKRCCLHWGNAVYMNVLHGERTIFIKEPTSMERKWGFPRGNRRWISLQRGARISSAAGGGQISPDLHFNPTSRQDHLQCSSFWENLFFFKCSNMSYKEW